MITAVKVITLDANNNHNDDTIMAQLFIKSLKFISSLELMTVIILSWWTKIVSH